MFFSTLVKIIVKSWMFFGVYKSGLAKIVVIKKSIGFAFETRSKLLLLY